MDKHQCTLALIIPSLGALLLVGWELVVPVAYGDIQLLYAQNVYVTMLGVPAWIWVVAALSGYAVGVVVIVTSLRRAWAKEHQMLGLGLAAMPAVIVILALFCAQYRGP